MPKKTNKYTEEDILQAIKQIKEEKTSVLSASIKYGIPRMTLTRRLKGIGKTKCGPLPLLTEDEEKLLEEWVLECARKGFPRRKIDLLLSVKEMMVLNDRTGVFKNDLPGDGWYRGFLKRHPILSLRASESVTGVSACVSEKDIKGWFPHVTNILVEDNVDIDVLSEPSRIFNGDESGFLLCPKNSAPVLAKKGCHNVLEIDTGQPKSSITVMFTFSASSMKVPPMLIFPYKRIPSDIVQSVPGDWGIGRSETGWMRAEVFYEYIANIFGPFLQKNNIQRPVILFVDGHKSYLTRQLSELCTEIGIILISLYPNATRLLQPADVSVFKPLKEFWKSSVNEWKISNLGKQLTKKDFAPLLQTVLEKINPDVIINGFKATGIYPWNPDSINYERFLTSAQPEPNIIETMDFDVGDSTPSDSEKFLSKNKFEGMAGVSILQKIKQNNLLNEAETCLKKIHSFFEEGSKLHPELTDNISRAVGPDESNFDNILHQSVPLSSLLDSSNPDYISAVPSTSGVRRNLFPDALNKGSGLARPLFWPESPKRKGKRNVERWPFVVSSSHWKRFYNEKKGKKEQEAIEKEDRRKMRIQKKTEKLKKKSAPKTSSAVGLCFQCGSNVKQGGYKCTECKRIYHHKCLPKSFEANLPDEEDGDEFVCPFCLCIDDEDEVGDSEDYI